MENSEKSSTKNVIRFGTTIQLKSGLNNGSYLNAHGWATKENSSQYVAVAESIALVSVTKKGDKPRQSESWIILSADRKPIGDSVEVGDDLCLRKSESCAWLFRRQ